MSLTTKQIVFFFLFLLSWLLLLLLGESYLSYVLLGGVSLFFLFFVGEVEWQRVNNYKWLAILWLLFLAGAGLSLIFSINLPISIYFMVKHVFVFLAFWFFILIKKSFISNQQVVKLFLLIGLVVFLVSTSFKFFPNLANLLPGMNLIHATYGHNHLAALLLLLIPLSWWLAIDRIEDGQSYWWLFLPVAFNLGLLFSFGRVAVVISLIQFLFIYQQLKKDNLFKKYYFSFIFKILGGLLLLVLLGNAFFSTVSLINPDFSCPTPNFKKQLCKPISAEFRPQYWRWSIEIFKDNFLLGSGPGTFSLAAKKYRLDSFGGSAHAHNAFLEQLSEIGLLGGGLFIALMLGLIYLSSKGLERKRGWARAALLGVAAIYINVLFDFDWSFIGIFSISLILLSLILKDNKTKLIKNNFSRFFKIIYFVFVFILIFVAGLYLKTDSFIKAGNTQKAFRLFPYFHWHRKIYETASELNPNDKQKFYKIYHAQTDVYLTRISETKNDWQRQLIKEKWFVIDPWVAMSQDLVSYYLDQNDLDQAQNWLQREQNFYIRIRDKGHKLDFKTKIDFGERSLLLVQAYLDRGDIDNALRLLEEILSSESIIQFTWEQQELMAQLLVEIGNDLAKEDIVQTIKAYELAKKNLPWILIINEIWFEKYPQLELSLADLMQYLELTADWQGEAIGWKDRAQQKIALQYVEKLLLASDWQNFNKIIRVLHWSEYEYYPRLELVRQISLKTDELVVQGNYEFALQLAQSMNFILPNDYYPMSQPAKLAILIENFDYARQLYHQCEVDYKLQLDGKEHHRCKVEAEALTALDQGQMEVSQVISQTRTRYFQVSKIIRGEAVW